MPRGEPLTRERILDAAVELADEGGVGALSMRALARHLSAGAMSLYNHIDGKDDLIDGITDRIAADFEPPAGPDWKPALRTAYLQAHQVLLDHPWACTLMMSRPDVGPARLAFYDAVLRTLYDAGFRGALARRGFLALDTHLLGFTQQESLLPFEQDELSASLDAFASAVPADVYPGMARMLTDLARTQDFGYGYDFVLDLLLDGLERTLHAREA